MYQFDKRIVMTLDAGGTNFVFSAIRSNEEIVEPIVLPSNGDNLEKCLETMVTGFSAIKLKLPEDPVAISFAFPGPADYVNGIIGDLKNLPAFQGGVALGAFLRNKFGIPVFINNDGDLFAYGEALAGALPEVNRMLRDAGKNKVYKNLIGITLGTGFGGGVVRDGELFWVITVRLLKYGCCGINASRFTGSRREFRSGRLRGNMPDCPGIHGG